MNNNTVLITGASGYVGSRIGVELTRAGFDVLGLDMRPPELAVRRLLPKRVLLADITRPETLTSEIRNAGVLIHCAALVHRKSADLSRSSYFRVNLEGTRNLLQALDGSALRQIVYLSTVSVYGLSNLGERVDEMTTLNPIDPYGESKLAAENEIRAFSVERSISFRIFRLAPVYGKDFLLNINKRVYLPKQAAFYKIGDGTQRISMCAVGNVVSAVSQSLEGGGRLGGVFNLKDTEDYSVNEIIAVVRKFNKHLHRPVLKIPRAPLMAFIAILMRQNQGKKANFVYRLSKIALDSVCSGEKLLSTGIRLPWNLSSELFGEGCP